MSSEKRLVCDIATGQTIEEDFEFTGPTLVERRQEVINKWDQQIDAKREVIRRMQDEGKPAAAISKIKADLKTLVASKNTELQGVV